jgi:multiple sugar transport system substrate-binding protein
MSLKRFFRLIGGGLIAILLFSTISVFADNKVTIKYLTHSVLEEPSRTIILNGIKNFESKHPNIHIEVEGVPNDQIQQKIVTYMSMRMLPDVVGLQGVGIEPFASGGNLLDITSRAKKDKLNKEFFSLEAATGLNGKIYGLPLYGGTDALFYNPKLFQEAGLDPNKPPKTWAQLFNYAKKLTKPDKGQYGMGIYGKTVHAVRIMHYMSNAGANGDILRLNRKKNNSWDILVNSPDSLKAWEYLKRFVAEKVAPPNTVELTYPDLISLFAQGKVAMLTTGPWGMATIKAANPNCEFRIAMHPTPDGQVPKLRTAPLVTVISKDTKHPNEAYAFLKYLTVNIGAEMAGQGYGILTRTAANNPQVKSNPAMKIFAQQQKYAYFSAQEILLPEWLKCKDQAWGPAWESMLIGSLSPKEAVKQAAKRIKEILGDKGNLVYPVK